MYYAASERLADGGVYDRGDVERVDRHLVTTFHDGGPIDPESVAEDLGLRVEFVAALLRDLVAAGVLSTEPMVECECGFLTKALDAGLGQLSAEDGEAPVCEGCGRPLAATETREKTIFRIRVPPPGPLLA